LASTVPSSTAAQPPGHGRIRPQPAGANLIGSHLRVRWRDLTIDVQPESRAEDLVREMGIHGAGDVGNIRQIAVDEGGNAMAVIYGTRAALLSENPLNLEVEALLFFGLILAFVKAVQPRSAVHDVLLDFVQTHEDVQAQDLLTKVAFVERGPEHDLV
jgi:hypothetical protein